MDINMVRPWKDPWELSPSLQPWEAWAVLKDLCGLPRPVRLPRLSRVAFVGRVCHCICGGDRCPVRPVSGNGSFGCGTIAARTRDLVLHTLPVVTSIYRSYLSVVEEFDRLLRNYYHSCEIFESCGDPDPRVALRRGTPPPQAAVLGTRCNAWV